jgi:hypothetical protein
MVKHSAYLVVAAVVLMGGIVSACEPAPADETQAPATPTTVEQPQPSPPAKDAPPAGRCGDGICDEAEQDNPNLCPKDCQTPTDSPTDAPPPTDMPSPRRETPDHPCGDGVCDGPENPENCPEDCAAGTPPAGPATQAPAPASGGPDYEPPINIYLVLHIDPIMDLGGATFKVEPFMYTRTRDEIEWLADEAARHGMHFTALFNGWYPKWALDNNDTTHFAALVDAGHELGSHAHRLTYNPADDTWYNRVDETDRWGRPNYDYEITRQCWHEADRYMDEALAAAGVAGQNQTMCAYPFKCSDEGVFMDEFGFTIASGNRSEQGDRYFGHIVWNPWRPAASDEPGRELVEDLNATFVAVDHLAQIGSSASHGRDVTVPQLQRRFLMLYAEWLARERSGADDRVWVFGFCHHPNYGDRYNAQITEFLSWLDQHFVGKLSPNGNTIARYATAADIAQQYVAWETDHPGTSSFSYGRGDPYPYSHPHIPSKLEAAAYEAHVDLGPDVSCFRFSKDGRPIYLMWSDRGEQTVDLSQVSGQVRVTNSAGQESVMDAAALHISEEPLIVEPL